MHDLFNLSDAIIRDLPHVRVTRKAPESGEAGQRCKYQKSFKPEGLSDANYWIGRENQFLLDFATKGLRHAVELSDLKRVGGATHAPMVSLLATFDAGITVEDWLRVQPRYPDGETHRHPFRHAGMFLLLVRACLVALQEIHSLGIVHCDIKPDNICLPYNPYPFIPGQQLGIDFDHIRLIDFAFAIIPERPLDRPLPVLPEVPYQSNLLKAALSADHKGLRRGGRPAVQDIDWRADLYSLGYMMGHILDAGLMPPAGSAGKAAYDEAHRLIERLRSFDGGKRPKGDGLPHDGLIGEIDDLLGNLVDLDIYKHFDIVRVRATGTADADGSAAGMVSPSPPTPLAMGIRSDWISATPLAAVSQAVPAATRLPSWLSGLVSMAIIAGLAIAGTVYWLRPPASAPAIPVQTPPIQAVAVQTNPEPALAPVLHDCQGCPEMVLLPAGVFQMGSDESDKNAEADEKPSRPVTISKAFYLGETEVTRAQFTAFVEDEDYQATGCHTWDGTKWVEQPGKSWRDPGYAQKNDNHPVVCVSFEDAQAYARWLSHKTSRHYRLPTEAEWEYAARAGTTTIRYWKDNDNPCLYANFADMTAKPHLGGWKVELQHIHDCQDGHVYTAPVRSFDPNDFKLYDMLGNVWEWVCSPTVEPYDGSDKACASVRRGGSWFNPLKYVRSANRDHYEPTHRHDAVGFRVVREID